VEQLDGMTRLSGKTAVITGGATGIGRAAAKRFIDEGAFVFIFGRRQEALDAAVADLGANARAVQKALPLMSEGGSIILTGSSAGTTGAPAFTAYAASKAAVRNLSKTWAEDLKGTGIRVNVLSPGATATELAKEALGEEGQKAFASMNPLQRMAEPAEIGAVAAFLASPDSSYMTASEVAVDGGLGQI
jgi:NAD(P)-dependent dehydrogenase (short-subunit alcohol dehydrogenase family)